MRLFVALDLPESAREEVVRRTAPLARELPPASWARASSLHVTLAFVGEVEPEAMAGLPEALDGATAPLAPFVATIAGAGAFPPRGRARVLWLGLSSETPLGTLAGAVRTAVGACGLPCDEKPFRPHLTIARCRDPWAETERERAISALASLPPIPLEVDRVTLFESRLDARGAEHSVLSEARLGGAP